VGSRPRDSGRNYRTTWLSTRSALDGFFIESTRASRLDTTRSKGACARGFDWRCLWLSEPQPEARSEIIERAAARPNRLEEDMTSRLTSGVWRILVTACVGGVVAAVIGGVSLAQAGGSSRDRTLVLKEVDVSTANVNISHTQQGAPGDEFIIRFNLLNHGEKAGWGEVVCTLVIGPRSQCQATARLAGGDLTISGLNPFVGNRFTLAITGGTGLYDGASGQVTRIGTGQNTARDVFDIDS
jgi:hypothetical protein